MQLAVFKIPFDRVRFEIERREAEGGRFTRVLDREDMEGVNHRAACLLVDVEGQVVGASTVQKVTKPAALQATFAFEEIILFENSIEWDDLLAAADLSASQRVAADRRLAGGAFASKSGDKLWDALTRLAPDYGEALARIAASTARAILVDEPDLDLLIEEREAVFLAANIFGVGREKLRALQMVEEAPPARRDARVNFLERVGHQAEDSVINRDARHFYDWLPEETASAAAIEFQSGSRRLTVINANKQPLEKLTGADLIYYNQTSGAFVLVQYKMMSKEPGGRDKPKHWVVRADAQFDAEIERMDRLEATHRADITPKSVDEYRIGTGMSYFKLLKRDVSFDGGSTGLLPGYYLPTPLVTLLLTESLGPQNGRRIVEEEVSDLALTQAVFARLVASGLIGTAKVTEEGLRKVVEHVLSSGKSLVLGIETQGDDGVTPVSNDESDDGLTSLSDEQAGRSMASSSATVEEPSRPKDQYPF